MKELHEGQAIIIPDDQEPITYVHGVLKHALGKGYTDEESLYVPIPKNGHTSHREMFLGAGWREVNYATEGINLPVYIVVRDPIDRWFSGIRQITRDTLEDQNPFPEETPTYAELLDQAREGGRLVFDQHTVPQSVYLMPTATMFDRVLVRLEDAAEYAAQRWGLTLPLLNKISRPPVDSTLTSILAAAYADDMRLYEQARSE